jgi:hypothetical protein
MDELERGKLQLIDARHAHLDESTGGTSTRRWSTIAARAGGKVPSAIRAVRMPL